MCELIYILKVLQKIYSVNLTTHGMSSADAYSYATPYSVNYLKKKTKL